MPPNNDDAREIPQRRPRPRQSAEQDYDFLDDGEEVYVVDTRTRNRGRAPQPQDAPDIQDIPSQLSQPERMPPRADRAPARAADAAAYEGSSQRPARAANVAAPGRPGPPQRQVRPRRGRILALGLILLLLAYVGFEAWTPVNAWSGVTRVEDAPTGERPAQGDGHNYLLVGSDSRADMSAADKNALGTGDAEGARTDSIILVHVPGSGGKSTMISIPRDSFVPIPGHDSNKINASFAFGGPKLLTETVEQVTGLRIDGYLEIGFDGFAELVDSMNGVDICVPFDMNDEKAHINLKQGCQTLDGKNALGYVRARYSDPRGDIGRAQRQRQFLAAIMKKMATPSTVLVPWTWWDTSHAAVKGLRVGQDTGLSDAYRIVQTMRGASSGDTLSLVVPLADTQYQTPAGEAVKWDTERARSLFAMLKDGTPIESPPPGTDGKPSGNVG